MRGRVSGAWGGGEPAGVGAGERGDLVERVLGYVGRLAEVGVPHHQLRVNARARARACVYGHARARAPGQAERNAATYNASVSPAALRLICRQGHVTLM